MAEESQMLYCLSQGKIYAINSESGYGSPAGDIEGYHVDKTLGLYKGFIYIQ